MAWILRKSHLQTKPVLTQGLASPNEDRQLELGYQNLRQLEDVSKKLYKEVWQQLQGLWVSIYYIVCSIGKGIEPL